MLLDDLWNSGTLQEAAEWILWAHASFDYHRGADTLVGQFTMAFIMYDVQGHFHPSHGERKRRRRR